MSGNCTNCGVEAEELELVFGYLVCRRCADRAYVKPNLRDELFPYMDQEST